MPGEKQRGMFKMTDLESAVRDSMKRVDPSHGIIFTISFIVLCLIECRHL